jgi:hypothetical protein
LQVLGNSAPQLRIILQPSDLPLEHFVSLILHGMGVLETRDENIASGGHAQSPVLVHRHKREARNHVPCGPEKLCSLENRENGAADWKPVAACN